MARYNRINLGDHQDTVTSVFEDASQAGVIKPIKTGAKENGVVFEGCQEGLSTDGTIPAGHSVQLGRLYSSYTYAVLTVAAKYEKGQALKLGAGGKLEAGDDEVVAYADESVTLSSDALLKVRIK